MLPDTLGAASGRFDGGPSRRSCRRCERRACFRGERRGRIVRLQVLAGRGMARSHRARPPDHGWRDQRQAGRRAARHRRDAYAGLAAGGRAARPDPMGRQRCAAVRRRRRDHRQQDARRRIPCRHVHADETADDCRRGQGFRRRRRCWARTSSAISMSNSTWRQARCASTVRSIARPRCSPTGRAPTSAWWNSKRPTTTIPRSS